CARPARSAHGSQRRHRGRGARRTGPTSSSLCELFAGTRVDEHVVRVLLAPLTALSVDTEVAARAGRVRRETGTRIADALIAATALEHGLSLVTRNVRDFAAVPGLMLCSVPS